jgi:hypothetical protein
LKLQSVIAGLDPAIHPLRKNPLEEDGCPDHLREDALRAFVRA